MHVREKGREYAREGERESMFLLEKKRLLTFTRSVKVECKKMLKEILKL